MKEQFAPQIEQVPELDEFKDLFFEYLEGNTKVFTNAEYQRLYILHKTHWGINSPACILPKGLFAKHPYSRLIPKNISDDLIMINGDAVSDPVFIEYLREHEYSELYIKRRPKNNLFKETQADFALPILERKRPSHRYATQKEFEKAAADGKLEEYMQWWREFYEADIKEIQSLPEEEIARISKNYGENNANREMIIQFIKNNLALKEDVYKSLK